MQRNVIILVCKNGFVHRREAHSFTGLAISLLCNIVHAQNHILGRNRHRASVRRLQEVVRGQQKEAALCLGLYGQRQMDCHLITVEVRVEGRADQRMKLDCLTLYQDRLESLNSQSVKCRCTVQHHRMLFDDILKDVPYLRIHTLYQLLRILDVLRNAALLELLHNEGLEQLQCHFLRNTALIDLHFRTNDDNRTSGIVNTLTQKVLTETSALTLEHVGQRLERTVAGACYGTAAAAVVDQGIHRLLQHSLLVAHDDVRRAKLEKSLQTVVTVDNSAVQIIQIRCCKTSAVQLDHRTKIRRNHRNAVHHHPGRLVSALAEGLNDLQSLDDAGSLLAGRVFHLLGKLLIFLLNIHRHQKLLDSLRTHAGAELAAPLLLGLLVLTLRQNLLVLQVCRALIQDNIVGKIKDLLQHLRAHIQNESHSGRNSLEIPDMRNRSRQFNVAHSLSADRGLGNLNAAAVADYALIANLLVFSAFAFPVLGGSENLLAEQAVFLRLQRSVVDGFGLRHFTVGPFTDSLRRRKPDPDCVKCYGLITLLFCIRHLSSLL